jgi:hypothetical protein
LVIGGFRGDRVEGLAREKTGIEGVAFCLRGRTRRGIRDRIQTQRDVLDVNHPLRQGLLPRLVARPQLVIGRAFVERALEKGLGQHLASGGGEANAHLGFVGEPTFPGTLRQELPRSEGLQRLGIRGHPTLAGHEGL